MKSGFCALTLLSVTALSSPVYAAGEGPREACKEDAHTFCSDVQPGGGRIIECLENHYKDISDACYNAMQKMAKRRQGSANGEPPPPPPPRGAGNNDGFPPPPPSQGDGNDRPPPPPQGGGKGGPQEDQ